MAATCRERPSFQNRRGISVILKVLSYLNFVTHLYIVVHEGATVSVWILLGVAKLDHGSVTDFVHFAKVAIFVYFKVLPCQYNLLI
jgi:hypothetical protein